MNKMEGHVSRELDIEGLNFFKRGGTARSIYEASTNFKFEKDTGWVTVTKEDLIELCEGFEKQGEKIRLAKKVPQNMAIFDQTTVFISLSDLTIPRNNRTDIIIRNKNFASYMVELFELYWKNSNTLEEFKNMKTK